MKRYILSMSIAAACLSITAPPASGDTFPVVSLDLAARDSLANTTKTYEFKLGTFIPTATETTASALRLIYGRESQSLTNIRLNAVDWTLEILTDGTAMPVWQQADRYPSDTSAGPIPMRTLEHVIDMGTNTFHPGCRMRLTVTVRDGDFLNSVQWIRLESDWNIPSPAGNVLYGVNLSGAEWGTPRTGMEGVDWAFPTEVQLEYYASLGLKQLRIPLAWERLQPAPGGDPDPHYLSRMDALAAWALKYGVTLIWDLHNYGRYDGHPIGSAEVPLSALADIWGKLAGHYAARPDIMFGLMNEPHDMPTETVVEMQNLAILAIRATGATNTIVVTGNGWSGAASWNDSWYGTPNAAAMLNIHDPASNVLFAVHLYFDSDASGTNEQVVSETIGIERLQGVAEWARMNGKRICIEEVGAARDSLSLATFGGTVDYVEANRDVFHAMILWSGGPLWAGNYMFCVEPDVNYQMAPQLEALSPHLAADKTPFSLDIAIDDVIFQTNILPAPITANWHQGYDGPCTMPIYPSKDAKVVSLKFDNGSEWNRITAISIYAVFGENRRELVFESDQIPFGGGQEIVFGTPVCAANRLDVVFNASLNRAIFTITGLIGEIPRHSAILSPRGVPFGSRVVIEEASGDMRSWVEVASFYYGSERCHVTPLRETEPLRAIFRAHMVEE